MYLQKYRILPKLMNRLLHMQIFIIATTEFTSEWAQVLLKLVDGSASVAAIRDLTLGFKHKAFTDLNAFHRMLGASENDYYSLYK